MTFTRCCAIPAESKIWLSATKVLSYWKDLLRHCQVDVNKLFRREYPLINDDGLVSIHALSVTMVSNLLEAGVSIDIIRDLVGHATWPLRGRNCRTEVTVPAAETAVRHSIPSAAL
jgi:hypothetical protein